MDLSAEGCGRLRVDLHDLVESREAEHLADRGLEPGELIGSLLRGVREAQLEGSVRSREEALDWARAALEAGGAQGREGGYGEEEGDVDVGAFLD